MNVSRRTFLKTTIVGGAGVSAFGFSLAPIYAQTRGLKIDRTTETRSTCPYCSVSCGVIIHTIGDKAKNVTPQVVHVEGDPDHPINRGTLCPKGAATYQLHKNPNRITKVLHRQPGARDWEVVELEWAMDRVAELVKQTRDETFIERMPNGRTAMMTPAIFSLGGATLNNEWNHTHQKLMRGLGIVAIENQARI